MRKILLQMQMHNRLRTRLFLLALSMFALFLSNTYAQGVNDILFQSNFTGTNPGQNKPWANTSVLHSNISMVQGWWYPAYYSISGLCSEGGGVIGKTSTNSFGFSVNAGNCTNPDQRSPLAEAIEHNEYISVKFSNANDPINLNSAEIRYTVNRLSSHAPKQFAVFSSLQPFTEGNQLFTSTVSSTNTSVELVGSFPSTGLNSVTDTVEIRIYVYDAIYYGHQVNMEAFKLTAKESSTPPIVTLIESNFTGTAPGANKPWTATSTLNSNISLVEGWSYQPYSASTGVMGATDINDAFGISIDAGNVTRSTLDVAIASKEYISLKIAPVSGSLNLNRAEIQFAIKRIGGSSATKYAVFTSLQPFTAGNEIFTGSVTSTNVNTVFTGCFPGSGYENVTGTVEIRIYMYDAFYYGHKTSLTAFRLKTGDLGAPSTPTALTATAANSYSIQLAWNASTDNVGVAAYDIYKNGTFLATTTNTSFTAGVFAANTSASFSVKARDVAGNVSAASNTASAITPSPASINERSPLGTNLSGISDWMSEHPFINLAKYSRPWGLVDQPWNAYNGLDGRPTAAEMIDAKGYLKAGKAGAAIVVCNGYTYSWPVTGVDYVCRYEGEGTVQLKRGGTTIQVLNGRAQFSVPAGCTDMLQIQILSNSLTNPVRNIWISELQYESYYTDQTNPNKMFYPAFMANWEKFKVLRFMDWMSTNNSPITSWQNTTGDFSSLTAPSEGDFTWRVKGVPVEVMVKYANKTNSDPWFCMPHQATDSYMSSFASYVNANLASSRKAYIEYSNECWNWQFAQAQYCIPQGSAIWGSSDGSAYQKYYSLRSIQMFHLWEAAFGNNTSRLVRTFAWQAAGSSNTLLDLEYAAGFSGKAYTHGDAIAIAPYFAGSLDGYNSAALNMTVTQILDYCDNYVNTSCQSWISSYSTKALACNLSLIAYEGGQHLVANGADKDATPDSTNLLLDKFTQVNNHSRMKDIYLNYLNVWKNNGGNMFCSFSSVGEHSKYGHWGVKVYESQPRVEAPKYDALLTFIEQNDIWFVKSAKVVTDDAEVIQKTIRVYPNPTTSGYVTVTLPQNNSFDKSIITVIDLSGKVMVKKETSDESTIIETSQLYPGTYILMITSKNAIEKHKLIVR